MNTPLDMPGSNAPTTVQGEQALDEVSTPHETLHNGMSLVTEKRSQMLRDCSSQRQSDVGSIIAHHETIDHAGSLASIDCPPSDAEELPPAKIYRPLSIHVLGLLMPASIFGVLARLGLEALTTYDGQAIFPLAYIQATGCFIMGIGLRMKAPFGNLYAFPFFTSPRFLIPIRSAVMVRCTRLLPLVSTSRV